jgi:hypothetical protein
MPRPPSRLRIRRGLAVTGAVFVAAAGVVGVGGPASAAGSPTVPDTTVVNVGPAARVGVVVPNLRALDRDGAIFDITNVGLVVGTIGKINNCVDPGTVQSQNPAAGRVVPLGSAVNFKLSTCVGGDPR